MSADLETPGRPQSPPGGPGATHPRPPSAARPRQRVDGRDEQWDEHADDSRPADPARWSAGRRRARRALLAAGAVVFLLVTADVLLSGPLRAFDSRFAFDAWHGADPTLNRLSRALLPLGQRAWVSPVLLGVSVLLAARRRSWRPLVVAGLGLLALNVVAGALKLGIGRSNPYSGSDHLFVGGTEYPGGHASNVVLTWGLLCWVLARYSRLRVRPWVAAGAVAVPTLLVTGAGLYLDWHWFSDQVGGVLLGAVLLGVIAEVDERAPAGVGLRSLRAVRGARRQASRAASGPSSPAPSSPGAPPRSAGRLPAAAAVPADEPAPVSVEDADGSTAATRVVAVVVTHRRRDLLRACLAAVQGQTRRPDVLVVVDNASADGTAEQVRAEHPEADLVVLSRNTGGAGGFTAGLAHALGHHAPDLLWLLDDDCVPHPTALERLLDVAVSDLAPALVASRVVWTDGRDHPMNTPRPRPLARPGERERAAAHLCVPIRSASFVSVLVDAVALRSEGLPVADYFLWNDDFELTLRLLRTRTGVLCPGSVVEHRTRAFAGPETDPGERFVHEVRNKLWLLRLSPGLSAPERVLYAGATARHWLRTIARSPRRGVLLRGLAHGVARGLRDRPRPNAEVLAGLGLDLPPATPTTSTPTSTPKTSAPATACAPVADPLGGSPP
ncbi:MAG: glycosyltransferase [Motilibacteraceae bacterium]